MQIFNDIVTSNEQQDLGQEIIGIVTKTLWAAFTGIMIGLAMGIFNQIIFSWLEHRSAEPFAEVAFTVGGAYMTFYITQVLIPLHFITLLLTLLPTLLTTFVQAMLEFIRSSAPSVRSLLPRWQ